VERSARPAGASAGVRSQTLTPALYGRPDGLKIGIVDTSATLALLSGRFKLLITAIITSVGGSAREGGFGVIFWCFQVPCF
jgi:hypothetical protein